MKIAVVFTVPIFAIAMIEMAHNNPLLKLMDASKWNWVQLILSLPVVFYACWIFFIRAWKSVITCNLNMFTLIGIGTGVAFLFSLVGMFFLIFSRVNLKQNTEQYYYTLKQQQLF